MAEERLIDDDKDRKYRVRKNADGEDELYIVPDGEQEEETDAAYLVPELEEDDEEAAGLTPEELAEREREREEAEAAKLAAIENYASKAKALFDAGEFDAAAYAATQALDLSGGDGAMCCLKLRAVTKNFSDFSRADDCRAAADGVKRYASPEQKEELCADCGDIKERFETLSAEVESLKTENETKKTERRGFFKAKLKKSLIVNAAVAAPFLVCLIVTLCFANIMFANLDYTNQIITFTFAGISGALFIALVFTLRNLWKCKRNVSLNEKNSSTKLGREYEEKKSELKLLETVISSFKETV